MKNLSEKSVAMIKINKWRFVSLVAYWLFLRVGCGGEGEGEVVSIPGLILEHDVDPDSILEGSTINFQCILHTNTSGRNNGDSNDHGYEILWLHNDEPLEEMGATTGLYLSANKLELSVKNVGRWSSGQYVCLIKTHSGEVISNTIEVSVKYKPQCKTHENTVFGASKNEQVEIECKVDANPPPLDKNFKWAFHSSLDFLESDSSETSAEDRFPNTDTNILLYTPKTDTDYGSVLCWATNKMGELTHPCVYQVILAGKPEAPFNCSTREMSGSAREGENVEIEIECTEGYDGGLAQIFHLEVAEARGGKLLHNLTSRVPFFLLRKPWTKEGFWMTIYSSNSKGRSSNSLPLSHYLVHDDTTVELEMLSHPLHLEQNDILEGENVSFKCTIHPEGDVSKYKLEFLHDLGRVKEDANLGIRITKDSLFLNNVTKEASGKYHCLLTVDTMGREKLSTAIDLRIKFKPTCKDITTLKLEYAALVGETVDIDCKVESYPEVTNHEWLYQNVNGQMLIKTRMAEKGATLSYNVESDENYGSVLCWATNELGRQDEPCTYHVIPAERPVWAWGNCTVNNVTSDSFDIDCLDGVLYDHVIALPFGSVIIKGLSELYFANIFDSNSSELLLNMSSLMPFFQVSPHNLEVTHLFQPEQNLRIVVYSANRVGDSNKIVLNATLAGIHQKGENASRNGTDSEIMTLSNIVGIGTGVACALCLVTLTVLASIIFAHKYRKVYNKADAAKNHPLVHL